MNIDKLEELAGRAGMYTDLMRMGAASLVYSPGCKGVALTELERFAALVRERALADASQLVIDRTPRDGVTDAAPMMQLAMDIAELRDAKP